jgi:hypothetical protein
VNEDDAGRGQEVNSTEFLGQHPAQAAVIKIHVGRELHHW